jgi:hypothetical protein
MAKVSRGTWDTTLAANVDSNGAGGVTAAEVRTVLDDLSDSVVWWQDTLTGGHASTSHDLGTVTTGTVTPVFTNGNLQRLVRGGAFTLAAPSGEGVMTILVTNNASAGNITFSGFDSLIDSAALNNTNGNIFLITIECINTFQQATVRAASGNA